MSNLLEQTEQAICARKLFRRGQKVLVAVSGGMDSMTLLHLLHTLTPKHGCQLTAAHFNHQLRGRDSDADERLVRETAKNLGLPFVSGRADVRRFGRTNKISIEMAARQLRHKFFARIAKQRKIPAVVLAHHADDQVELFFMRLLRGSGGEGLAGMKWMAPSPIHSNIKLIRPLLGVAKTDLEKFARENEIPFREDAGNASSNFQRNKVRRELLPLLRRKYQPALGKTISRVMEIVGAESEFVNQAAHDWLARIRRPAFADLQMAVQRRVLQLQLFAHGLTPEFELIESLRNRPYQPSSVTSKLAVFRDDAGKIHLRRNKSLRFQSGQIVAALKGRGGAIFFCGAHIDWKIILNNENRSQGRVKNCEFFDADKVGVKIILRHWRAGDRFQPIGMGHAVKLQDLFTNEKLPRAERHQVIVAVAADGEIFWVEKLRIGERFKLDENTLRRLEWSWVRR